MNAFSRCIHYALWGLGLLVTTGRAEAEPVLNGLLPFSASPGSHVTVELIGKDLASAEDLLFSVPGLSAMPVGEGQFVVSIPADAALQTCDVWCLVDGRLTNPRRFVISELAGGRERDGNDSAERSTPMTVPGAVDARLESRARIDWFEFQGEAGQSLTVRCLSRSLDGDVLPVIAVMHPDGHEIAHSSGRRWEDVVNLDLPANGTYRIRVNDRAYRQSANSFYRLELLSGPRCLAVFPDLLPFDRPVPVSAYGLKLSGDDAVSLSLAGDTRPLAHQTLKIPPADLSKCAWSASTEFFVAQEIPAVSIPTVTPIIRRTLNHVTVEDEPHTESFANSQTIEVPALLNGRFADRGDVDWYAFDARKGDGLLIDLYGDRYGRQMDLDASIVDDQDKVLATFPDLGTPKGLPPEIAGDSLDVSVNWKVPADGRYRLVVRDLYGSSVYGADRTYVMHVRSRHSAPRVIALPPAAATKLSSYQVPAGGHAAIRISAQHIDGLEAPAELQMAAATGQSALSAQGFIGRGQTAGILFLSHNGRPAEQIQFLDLQARVEGPNEPRTVPVRACTNADNAGIPGRFLSRLPVLVGPPEPLALELRAARTVVTNGSELQLTLRRTRLAGQLQSAAAIEFLGLPEGVTAPEMKLEPDAEELTTIISIPAELPPGPAVIAVRTSASIVTSDNTTESADKTRKITVKVVSNPLALTIESSAAP